MKRLFLPVFIVGLACCLIPSMGFGQTATDQKSDSDFVSKAIEANKFEIETSRMAQTRSQNPRVKEFANMMVQDHTKALDRLESIQKDDSSSTSNMAVDSKRQAEAQKQKQTPMAREHQQVREKLSKLSGSAFDREYINAMVKEHRNDVKEFERHAGVTGDSSAADSGRQKPGGTDPQDPARQPSGDPSRDATDKYSMDQNMDSTAVARELLPTLRNHLTHAEELQKSIR